VNDIVLAIMELRSPPKAPPASSPVISQPPPPSRISRVLYLDIDLHHGDGVESAFFTSPYVVTLSVHLHGALFFPSSGALDSSGPTNAKAPGRGHALNVALEPGLGEANFKRIWEICVEKIAKEYGADAVVVQMGVDGMVEDPCKVSTLRPPNARESLTSPTDPAGMELASLGVWLCA
jgi:histone deacetylase 8